ncbi:MULTISPECIES: hypothetical protein [Desulfosediminicola]|uniref:hypothetical protein n=1 Tax=Desulfosediminicola TaxID=2886823 RepID=UPI0010AC4E49|nr:hypothetical protein [Desulfosediminicola ganghwensis]
MNDSEKQQLMAEGEILLAIATAVHLETNFPEGRQNLTIKDDQQSPWGFTGKLQRITSRKNIQIRSRK